MAYFTHAPPGNPRIVPFMKNSNEIFFDFLRFCVGSIKECIYVCLSMQIQENLFMSTAAHV